MRLPSLPVLRAFEATVRHGSVMRAAKELHVTDGAVSRAVRELETTLGFDLFKRGNRLIIPTATARVLADDISICLDRLTQAMDRAQRSSGLRRPIVLSCEPTFLIRWLIPRLGSLQEALGAERELHLISAGGAVPFAREGIDLAIRRGDFEISDDVIAEPFLEERVGPVCRADLAMGLPRSGPMQGLLLHTTTRPQAWRGWSKLTGTELRPTRELWFEHFYLSLQAAVAGAGIAIGPIALVADDLANGSLLAPWGFVADGTKYVLMTPKPHEDAVTFMLVLDWLVGMGRDIPALGPMAIRAQDE